MAPSVPQQAARGLKPHLAALASTYGTHRPAIQKLLTAFFIFYAFSSTYRGLVSPSKKVKDAAESGKGDKKGRKSRRGRGPRVEVCCVGRDEMTETGCRS